MYNYNYTYMNNIIMISMFVEIQRHIDIEK